MKRNDIVQVLIDDMNFPNIGLGSVNERRLAVKGGLLGQRLSVRIVSKGKKSKGQIVDVIEPCPDEISPKCQNARLCGGCTFQSIPYECEIKLKTKMVKKVLAMFDIEDCILPIVPAINPERYRNKMEFSFGDDGEPGNLTLGMRKRGSYYEAINADCCLLCHEDFGRIIRFSLDYFTANGETFHHKRKNTGTLRHLVIRRGIVSGEILVNIVTTNKNDYTDYANSLRALEPGLDGRIVGVLHTTCSSVADAIVPDEVRVLYGVDYYHEELNGLRFKVSAFSFFQTNSVMAEKLYGIVSDFAGDVCDKTVFDLYCGTGTIGIFLARHAKKVIGIEVVGEAVERAKENAAINNINNCEFFAGDVRKVIKDINDTPDVIVLDPPREGIHPKAIGDILAFKAKCIVYVSCKATSLQDDLPHFIKAGYMVEKVAIVDMFPRTANVEVVLKLVLAE